MADENTLVSYIEWDSFGRGWKLKTLKPSESLPPGAEKAEVWRNDEYALRAKISGKMIGSTVGILPEVKAGELIPLMDVQGSDDIGFAEYKIGPCIVGNILSSGWADRDADPPVVNYEAELVTQRAEWKNPHRHASEAEWLSEWYLNGPHDVIYPRGGVTELIERYERKRELPEGGSDSFDWEKRMSGVSFAFVSTPDFNFVVQHVPKELGPSWSECVMIEYRPKWGGIPESNTREAIATVVGFLLGKQLVNVGHATFDSDGYPLEKVAINPTKKNLVAICKDTEYRFVKLGVADAAEELESVLNQLVPTYLSLNNDLSLNEAIWFYWLFKELPIGANLPALGTGLETLANSWFTSRQSKTRGVYLSKEDFDTLLGEELATIEMKLDGIEYADRLLNRLRGSYSMGQNDRLRFFFDEMNLRLSPAEWKAIQERNFMAHGSSRIFDGSANERMRKATRTYETLFNRILLKLLGYDGYYTDYGTAGLPRRHIDEPSSHP